jgi:hypothetical protein
LLLRDPFDDGTHGDAPSGIQGPWDHAFQVVDVKVASRPSAVEVGLLKEAGSIIGDISLDQPIVPVGIVGDGMSQHPDKRVGEPLPFQGSRPFLEFPGPEQFLIFGLADGPIDASVAEWDGDVDGVQTSTSIIPTRPPPIARNRSNQYEL